MCCAVKFSKDHFTNLAYQSPEQATPSFATATTGVCGHIIVNDRILMKFDHQHKIDANPDCLMPLTAINNDVGNQIVLQSFGNNCRQGKTL